MVFPTLVDQALDHLAGRGVNRARPGWVQERREGEIDDAAADLIDLYDGSILGSVQQILKKPEA
jgi:hypothetical protein